MSAVTFPTDFSNFCATQRYPAGALYVVATPIGNIADITFRALYVLSLVDTIACEDTRHSAKLLQHYQIKKPLIAVHQHNEASAATDLQQYLAQGKRVALISDAGTPSISDPGAKIVQFLQNAGFLIIPIPGISAITTALSVSGLLSSTFYFVGFLPAKSLARQQLLQSLLTITTTLVFYEAPHRLAETIKTISEIFPAERQLVFARELTKLFEQIHRCPLSQALPWLMSDAQRQKGEFVILLEGATEILPTSEQEIIRLLTILKEELSPTQAASLVAKITGRKKKEIYEILLRLK